MSDDLVKRTKDLNAVILKNHEGNKKVFAAKKLTTKFTIRHSAKEVIYDCKNFIERNSDYISKSLN
jgi:myosin heavy subunit